MSDNVKVFLIVLLIVVWLGFRAKPHRADPALLKPFIEAHNQAIARHTALRMSKVAADFSAMIKEDGDLSTPDIASGAQLEDIRRKFTRKYEGARFEDNVPGLGEAIKNFLEARADNDPGELTPAKRKRWVKAYSDLSEQLKIVSQSF